VARHALIFTLLLARLSWSMEGDGPAQAESPAQLKSATDVPLSAWFIPALETELLHLSFLAFTNLVSQESFGLISLDTIASHIDGRKGWYFDTDYFSTNQLGHPYQGALTFTAARSAGISFWWSTVYTFMASLTWELIYEVDPPSINDQITTTLGGILLGEVLHRAALLMWRDPTLPKPVRVVGSFLLEPLGGFNRWLFASDIDESDTVTPSWFALVGAGVSIVNREADLARGVATESEAADLALQAWFTYGVFDPRAPPDRTPLSHFDLTVSISPSELPLATLFIRGLLYGKTIGLQSPTLRGVWGLFGQYDYIATRLQRVSEVGFGPGTSLQWHFSRHGYLQATAMVDLSPFGAIGTLGLDEDLYRDYHIGPGASALLELRLINTEVIMLRGVARQWLVVGAYTPPAGFESMTHLTMSVVLKLGWRIAVAAELVMAYRVPKFLDDTYNRIVRDSGVQLSICYLSDEHFGVVAPIRDGEPPEK
jgi:hypothetical protein